MFNSDSATKNVPATVKLTDGRCLQGNIILAMSSDLPRTLNGESRFIQFETINGQRSFIAKTSLAEAIPSDIPKVKKLDTGTDSDKDFNPYRILQISPESDFSEVRTAYFERAKAYHPDRFSGVELPQEMALYAANMSRLINAAYQMLEVQLKNPAPAVNDGFNNSQQPATAV